MVLALAGLAATAHARPITVEFEAVVVEVVDDFELLAQVEIGSTVFGSYTYYDEVTASVPLFFPFADFDEAGFRLTVGGMDYVFLNESNPQDPLSIEVFDGIALNPETGLAFPADSYLVGWVESIDVLGSVAMDRVLLFVGIGDLFEGPFTTVPPPPSIETAAARITYIARQERNDCEIPPLPCVDQRASRISADLTLLRIVPEPTALALMGFALFSLLAARIVRAGAGPREGQPVGSAHRRRRAGLLADACILRNGSASSRKPGSTQGSGLSHQRPGWGSLPQADLSPAPEGVEADRMLAMRALLILLVVIASGSAHAALVGLDFEYVAEDARTSPQLVEPLELISGSLFYDDSVVPVTHPLGSFVRFDFSGFPQAGFLLRAGGEVFDFRNAQSPDGPLMISVGEDWLTASWLERAGAVRINRLELEIRFDSPVFEYPARTIPDLSLISTPEVLRFRWDLVAPLLGCRNGDPSCEDTHERITGPIVSLAVPEPNALALLGIATAGLLARRRRDVSTT